MKWFSVLVLILIIAAAVGWKMGWFNHAQTPVATSQTATSTAQSQQIQSGLPTQQSDTSDAAIARDSAAIDAQTSGLNSDSTAVGSSLNDKSTTQSF